MTYLTQYYDPSTRITDGESEANIRKEEIERLTKLLNVALTAAHIPRRIGADADPDELAADKKRCKRIAHVANQVLKSWGVTAAQVNGDVKREAAQVVWERWWGDHQTWLNNRMRYVATWGQSSADEKFAKTVLVKLNNELGWLQYAMR